MSDDSGKMYLKRPHDPIARSKLIGEIGTREALDALARHTQARAQWMLKAKAMMQMVNEPEADQAKLREMCDEHILEMPDL